MERIDLHAQMRQGVLRFSFRYATEPGLSRRVELGPTVQTATAGLSELLPHQEA